MNEKARSSFPVPLLKPAKSCQSYTSNWRCIAVVLRTITYRNLWQPENTLNRIKCVLQIREFTDVLCRYCNMNSWPVRQFLRKLSTQQLEACKTKNMSYKLAANTSQGIWWIWLKKNKGALVSNSGSLGAGCLDNKTRNIDHWRPSWNDKLNSIWTWFIYSLVSQYFTSSKGSQTGKTPNNDSHIPAEPPVKWPPVSACIASSSKMHDKPIKSMHQFKAMGSSKTLFKCILRTIYGNEVTKHASSPRDVMNPVDSIIPHISHQNAERGKQTTMALLSLMASATEYFPSSDSFTEDTGLSRPEDSEAELLRQIELWS